jgi:hypothetical protein
MSQEPSRQPLLFAFASAAQVHELLPVRVERGGVLKVGRSGATTAAATAATATAAATTAASGATMVVGVENSGHAVALLW